MRLNGTYAPRPRNAYFFHMDSWRLNLIPGYWVPAFIYSEEGDFSAGAKNKLAFKAQTRIWGYDLKKDGKTDELTQIRVDSREGRQPDRAGCFSTASRARMAAAGGRQRSGAPDQTPACWLRKAMSTRFCRPSSTTSSHQQH